MDDSELTAIIPDDYWLKSPNTRCLLAAMVHRMNKEVATLCSSLPPGKNRASQRKDAEERLATEREEARGAKRCNNDEDEHEQTHKKSKSTISRMSVIKSQNDLISTQVRLLQDNKESFLITMGEEKYHATIMSLLAKLPDPDVLNSAATNGGTIGSNLSLSTPREVASPRDDSSSASSVSES